MDDQARIWKVRSIKPYPDARNHILVGQVLAEHGPCVLLFCRTFHFGRSVNGVKDITVGPLGKRIIPWVRIEIINELSGDFDFQAAKLVKDAKGVIALSDGKSSCPLTSQQDRR
jgi:hypothetical protein